MQGFRKAHSRYTPFIQGSSLPCERSVYLVRVRVRVRVEVRARVTVSVKVGVRVKARVRVQQGLEYTASGRMLWRGG